MSLSAGCLCGSLGLALSLALVVGPIPEKAEAYEPGESRLLELINGHREVNDLATLVASEALSTAAKRHSDDMATYNFFSHNSEASSYYPTGSAYYDRTVLEGYPADAHTSENIAWFSTPEEAFETWLQSEVHNGYMLDPSFTEIGVGQDGSYWTADFGSGSAL